MDRVPPSQVEPAATGRSLEIDGYAIVRDVVDRATVADLAQRLTEYERDPQRFAGELEFRYERGSHGSVRRMSRLAWVEPERWARLWGSSPLLSVLAWRFGSEEIAVVGSNAFCKAEGTGSRTPYHQDQAFWPRARPDALCCWFALDRADEDNGCLVLYAGSHRVRLLPHDASGPHEHPEVAAERLERFSAVAAILDPGDAVIWDRYTVHGGGENRSDRQRRGVQIIFARASALGANEVPATRFQATPAA